MNYHVVACSGTSGTSDSSSSNNTVEKLINKPDAEITQMDNWTIVSTTENGDRVYWFLAPEVKEVTPAMFKKTVHTGNRNEVETVIVSECNAPKQTCDALMRKFKVLSKKYK